MQEKKNIIKLAGLILDALIKLKIQRLKSIQDGFGTFSQKIQDTLKQEKLLNMAVKKNWFCSCEHIVYRTGRNLADLLYHIQRFKEILDCGAADIPKLCDIYADIEALKQEFTDFNFDLKNKTLSVITEPVTLDDVSLGSFEIRLFINDLPKIYNDQCYRVIALNPNPASSDSDITHPHVSGERLCEGEGHISIRNALKQGRIHDFFTMVSNILNTYNSGSPYVRLEDWQGNSCYDCGYSISGDESYYCECCDHDFCPNCSTYCHSCDITVCLGCTFQCSDCGNPVCNDCTDKCSECKEKYCKNCLDENGLCKDCQVNRKEEDQYEEDDERTDSAVQSDGMVKDDIHA